MNTEIHEEGCEVGGNFLYCHKNLILVPAALEGKSYKVVSDNEEEIIIRNEQDEIHTFSKNPNDEAYFGKWFCYIK